MHGLISCLLSSVLIATGLQLLLGGTASAKHHHKEKHHRGERHPKDMVRPGLTPDDMAEKLREAINLLRAEARAERASRMAPLTDHMLNDQAYDIVKPKKNCCLNGGFCVMGSFCECPKGYSGQYCEHYDYDGTHRCGRVNHREVVFYGCTRCSCGDGILTCIPQTRCNNAAEGSDVWTVVYEAKNKRRPQPDTVGGGPSAAEQRGEGAPAEELAATASSAAPLSLGGATVLITCLLALLVGGAVSS